MGGGSKQQDVKYVGPTKEELAQRQADYDKQIAMLQEQNKGVSQKYDAMRTDSERALAERTTLMQQELARQQQAYDEVLGTTKGALATSEQAQQRQSSLMNELTMKQEQASKLQTAQTEKDTVMMRDQANLNKRSVDAATKATTTRKRRRGLMSTMSPLA
jgi:chromosome segregation ATPase